MESELLPGPAHFAVFNTINHLFSVKEENKTDRGQTAGETWQELKMLIGVIRKGEAAEGREGSGEADRETRLWKASQCLRDKVKERKRERGRAAVIVIQIVGNNKIPHR